MSALTPQPHLREERVTCVTRRALIGTSGRPQPPKQQTQADRASRAEAVTAIDDHGPTAGDSVGKFVPANGR